MAHEPLDHGSIFARGAGSIQHLLDGQKQLGYHVPVNAAKPLVLVERTGAAGEGLVVEHLLIQCKDARILLI